MTGRSQRYLAMAILAAFALATPSSSVAVMPILDRGVLVVLVPGASFERLVSVPEVRALARAGGAALMSSRTSLPQLLGEAFPKSETYPLPSATTDLRFEILEFGLGPAPDPWSEFGIDIRREVAEFDRVGEVMVVVASSSESPTMLVAKDELTPLIVASGPAGSLFSSTGALHTLASDTTRRTGVVSDEDVVPTILGFVGHTFGGNPQPEGLTGSILRVVDAPPPFELHERYLAQRRMSVPIGIAAGLYVTLAGLFGFVLLGLGRRVPPRLAHFAAWLAMAVPVLGVTLLAAGHLPTLSYATVVPFLIGVTAVGTLAFVPLRRFGALVPPAAIGAAVLAYFVVEAALGWTAALTPLHGGSELDGGRFYGLPNAFIGLLIGASLYVAHRMNTIVGFVLIVAVALFAGLPGIGANLGGAVALFAAAGLWLAQRRLGRIGWKGAVLTAVIVVVGVVIVLLAHRFLTSSPTHITRFEESPGGLGGMWGTFTDRLMVGWRLIVLNPFALVPVLGLPVVLVVLLRPPAPLRGPLAAHPEWRDALLVTILASMVAYVANDSGAAACGLGFALGLGGLFYVSLIEGTWKMAAT